MRLNRLYYFHRMDYYMALKTRRRPDHDMRDIKQSLRFIGSQKSKIQTLFRILTRVVTGSKNNIPRTVRGILHTFNHTLQMRKLICVFLKREGYDFIYYGLALYAWTFWKNWQKLNNGQTYGLDFRVLMWG